MGVCHHQHGPGHNCHGSSIATALQSQSFHKEESLCDVYVWAGYLVRVLLLMSTDHESLTNFAV